MALGIILATWHYSASQVKAQSIFQNRLHCRKLADEYVRKANAEIPTTLTSLDSVDFSSAANSCFALFRSYTEYVNGDYKSTSRGLLVVNLISGEELYQDSASETSGGAHGDWNKVLRQAIAAFQQAMNGKEVNVSKIK